MLIYYSKSDQLKPELRNTSIQFTCPKSKWPFWEAGFYPGNHSFFSSSDRLKNQPPKRSFLFWTYIE